MREGENAMTGKTVAVNEKSVLVFLRQIEEVITQHFSFDELRRRLSGINSELVRLCLEDLKTIKLKVLTDGGKWSGLITINSFRSAQNTSFTGDIETVEIRERDIRLIGRQTEDIKDTRKVEIIELRMSRDGRVLMSVSHRITKTFGFGADAEEIVILEETVKFRNNIIYRVVVLRNIDRPRSPTDSSYHKPRKAIIRHECVLPVESASKV